MFLILFLFGFAINSFAGMDFSGLGGNSAMVLPNFYNATEVVKWARETPYQDGWIQILKKEIKRLNIMEEVAMGDSAKTQLPYYKQALRIMQYKEEFYGKNIHIPTFKTKYEALQWAEIVSGNGHLEAYRRTLIRHMDSLRAIANLNKHTAQRGTHIENGIPTLEEIKRSAITIEQWDWCNQALKLIKERNVGAVFYAGSEPVERMSNGNNGRKIDSLGKASNSHKRFNSSYFEPSARHKKEIYNGGDQ